MDEVLVGVAAADATLETLTTSTTSSSSSSSPSRMIVWEILGFLLGLSTTDRFSLCVVVVKSTAPGDAFFANRLNGVRGLEESFPASIIVISRGKYL